MTSAGEDSEDAHFEDNDDYESEGISGNESDPLASDQEREPLPGATVGADLAGTAEEDDEEAIFGPSIDELLTEHRRRRGRRPKRNSVLRGRRARLSDIPTHLNSKVGAANLAFISNDYEKAETLFKAIVAEAPRCAAPQRALGLIYELRGDTDRALDHFMRAAALNRTDRDLWKRNAALWKEKGDLTKAILCLSKAISSNSTPDPEALRARAQLYLAQNRLLMAADSLIKLSRLEPFNLQNIQQIANCYVESNQIPRAIEVVKSMITNCEHQGTVLDDRVQTHGSVVLNLLELLVELKLRQKRFTEANILLARLRSLSTSYGSNISFVQRLMIAVCQHRLGSDVLAAPIFHEFMSSSALMDKHRFLVWQVGDAYYDSGHYHQAIDVYSALINMKNEEPRVDMYLRRALCYKEISMRDSCKADLETVLTLQPRHVVASLHLQEFLPTQNSQKRQKRSSQSYPRPFPNRVPPKDREEALNMLSQANEMFVKGNYEGYLSLVYGALDSALELRAPWRSKSLVCTPKHVRREQNNRPIILTESDTEAEGEKSRLSPQRRRISSHWQIPEQSPSEKQKLHKLGAALMRIVEQETYVEIVERVVISFRAVEQLEIASSLARVFVSLMHSRVSADEGLRRRLLHLELVTSIAAGAVWRAYSQSRVILGYEPTDVDALYSFTIVEQLAEAEVDVSNMRNMSYRSLIRLWRKNPKSASLAFVMGNISSRGAYNVQRYTVGFYLAALQICPESALLCLCLVAQVLYVSMGRRITNRNEVMPYALAFIKRYQHIRLKGAVSDEDRFFKEMETEYNTGRAMHQMGLVDAACTFYERVLKRDVSPEGVVLNDGGDDVWADIRRDAAFNLMQIYRNSKSFAMASKVCSEFLVF